MRAFIVAKRLIKQISADKRSLGLMFVAPVFILFLMNTIMTSSTSNPKIDLVSKNSPKAFVETLQKYAKVNITDDIEIAKQNLKNGKNDAYITFENNTPNIVLEGSSPTVSNMVQAIIKKSMLEMSVGIQGMSAPKIPEPKIEYLYGSKDMVFFDALAPLLMGFFIFFFVFLIAGVSFLRERISGTLDRILATPLKRIEIVFGYFLGFGIFIAIQTIIIQSFIVYGLNVVMKGSFWLVLLINLILAGQSLALGTLLSAFARNEFQLFQFIPIVIVPQILFSGIFDISEAPAWVTILSKIFPLTFGAEALKGVMIKGFGFYDIAPQLLILFGYAILFIALNSLALKKYRRI